MATLAEIRKQYPQYEDLTDQQIADGLYSKFYSDMDRGDFDRKIGLRPGWAWKGSIGGVAYDMMNAGADAEGYTPSAIPFLDPINAAANQFVSNIPVAGAALTNAGNHVDAAFNNALAPVFGWEKQTPEDRARINQAEAERFPVAGATGAVAGAVSPMIALGLTPMGATFLGNTGPMGQRALMGAISGGTTAGLDTLSWGGSPDKAAADTALGVAAGAVSPFIERAAAPIGRWLFGQKPIDPGTRRVAQALDNSGIDPREMTQMLDSLGPNAMPLDLSRNLTQQAGGVASVPGPASTTLADALTARQFGTETMPGANMRIQQDVTGLLGDAPVPSRLLADIRESQRALGPEYERVLQDARAVDTEDIALTLDSMIVNERGAAQTAAKQVRAMLNVTGTDQLDPNPATLLNTRQAIDGILYTDGAAAPLDKNVARILKDARSVIDAELAAKVPGIKEVDQKFAELAGQSGAVRDGQSLFETGRNTVTRPSELADLMRADESVIVGPSGVPFRLTQGARSEIDRIIGTTGNDITALKKVLLGEGSWNRDKLVSMYGREKTDELISILEREQRYANSYNRILQNSETAARSAAQREAMPAQINLDVQSVLTGIPQHIANTAARARSQAANATIAELLTQRPSPETIDMLLAAQAANRGRFGGVAASLIGGQ